MEKKEKKEPKIFHRYQRTVEVCGKCGGDRKVYEWPDWDIWKMSDGEEKTCPLCEGSGMLNKTVTITTDLSPFKP